MNALIAMCGMMARRFKKQLMAYQFHRDRLDEPWQKKKPAKIFVVSAGDMWGNWVPRTDIDTVLRYTWAANHHVFQFLTKNPFRYRHFNLPQNGWYGTTIDGTLRTKNNHYLLVDSVSDRVRFVSFEPLLMRVDPPEHLMRQVDWVIIGANSLKGAVKPPDAWADLIIDRARHAGCAVFVKDNYGFHSRIKEFPDAAGKKQRAISDLQVR